METKVDQAQQEIWDSLDEYEEQKKNGAFKFRLEFRFPDPRWQLPAPGNLEDKRK